MTANNPRRKPRPLTLKQRRFAEEYVLCGVAKAAYMRSRDCSNMKDATIIRMAHDELHKPKVQKHIAELQAPAMAAVSEKLEISVERITKMLLESYEKANKVNQHSAAITAAMGLAKIHGLVVDTVNQRNENYVVGIDKSQFEDEEAFERKWLKSAAVKMLDATKANGTTKIN